VEDPDYQGRQDEEDVEKMQDVLSCPHALRITSGRRSGLARSGGREHAESKEERSDSEGREKDEQQAEVDKSHEWGTGRQDKGEGDRGVFVSASN